MNIRKAERGELKYNFYNCPQLIENGAKKVVIGAGLMDDIELEHEDNTTYVLSYSERLNYASLEIIEWDFGEENGKADEFDTDKVFLKDHELEGYEFWNKSTSEKIDLLSQYI